MTKKKNNAITPADPLVMKPGVAYTAPEVARFLRLKPETLEVWRATGRYPALRCRKAGGKILYMGEDVMAFLDTPHQRAAPYVPKSSRPKLVVARRRPAKK